MARREMVSGVEIWRFSRRSRSGARLVRRTLESMWRSILICNALLWNLRKKDIVFAVTNPPCLPTIAGIASRLTGARLILLVHDVYPNAAVVAGVLSENSWIHKCARSVQQWTLQSAARVICIGRDMQGLLCSQFQLNAAAVRLIPNWAEEAIPFGRSKFRDAHTKRGAFVVLHAGNLGLTHDSSVMLAAAKELEHDPDIVFLFAAAGRLPEVLRGVMGSGRHNTVVAPMAEDRDQQWDTLAAGDVVIIAFKPGMAGISVPSRMYNAMAAGRAIIAVAEPESEIAQAIRDDNLGWVVSPGDAKGLAACVLEAKHRPEMLREIRDRALRVAYTRYSRNTALSKYTEVVDEVVGAGDS